MVVVAKVTVVDASEYLVVVRLLAGTVTNVGANVTVEVDAVEIVLAVVVVTATVGSNLPIFCAESSVNHSLSVPAA